MSARRRKTSCCGTPIAARLRQNRMPGLYRCKCYATELRRESSTRRCATSRWRRRARVHRTRQNSRERMRSFARHRSRRQFRCCGRGARRAHDCGSSCSCRFTRAMAQAARLRGCWRCRRLRTISCSRLSGPRRPTSSPCWGPAAATVAELPGNPGIAFAKALANRDPDVLVDMSGLGAGAGPFLAQHPAREIWAVAVAPGSHVPPLVDRTIGSADDLAAALAAASAALSASASRMPGRRGEPRCDVGGGRARAPARRS